MTFFYNPKQIERLFEKFSSYKEKKKFFDVSLLVNKTEHDSAKETFSAHKIVLACQSGYFKSQFTSLLGNASSKNDKFEVNETNATTFAMLLQYLYTNKLPYSPDGVADLIKTSDYLDIFFAAKTYANTISGSTFPLGPAIKLFQLTYAISKPSLWSEFSCNILRNFSVCVSKHRDQLLSLSCDAFAHLVCNGERCCTQEEALDIILDYIGRETMTNEIIEQLLASVSFDQVTKSGYETLIKKHGSAASNPSVTNYVSSKMAMLMSSGAIAAKDLSPGSYCYVAFLARKSHKAIYILDLPNKTVKPLDTYSNDPSLSLLHNLLGKLEEDMSFFHSLELQEGRLATVVGYKHDEFRLPCFMRYENKTWFNQYRTQLSLDAFVHTGYRILNVGGYDPNRSISLRGGAIYGQGPWHLIPGTMSVKRSEHTLSFHNGIVYATGGQNEQDDAVLQTAEFTVIDPIGDTWFPMAPMLHARQGHKAAAIDGKIFVVGGYSTKRSASEHSKSLVMTNEVYDISSNTWTEFPNFASGMHFSTLTAVDGKLIAVASREGEPVKKQYTVQEYDLKTNKWSEICSFKTDQDTRFTYSSTFTQYDVSLV
ncbi:hypothetical protein Ciccas_003301 [Cichlidogyrus casuarinus]|uniref:BTB domain-containing protein n=1 Tax=Cichlidogyrus casuarinus TaxID=1844966 RepID=A0ABD2QEU3_9PLAT